MLDCLRGFTNSELLEDISCQSCGAKKQANKRLTLRSLPVVVCFHLKRFKQNLADNTVTKIDTFVR